MTLIKFIKNKTSTNNLKYKNDQDPSLLAEEEPSIIELSPIFEIKETLNFLEADVKLVNMLFNKIGSKFTLDYMTNLLSQDPPFTKYDVKIIGDYLILETKNIRDQIKVLIESGFGNNKLFELNRKTFQLLTDLIACNQSVNKQGYSSSDISTQKVISKV
jgi:hypothetical protein